MIPLELQKINQWTHSFDVAEIKRPRHSHYAPSGGLPYQRAVNVAVQGKFSFGFYVTLKDAYVLGDIDHVDNPSELSTLPPYIRTFLRDSGIYSEISPSGTGVRFVCKLPSVSDKALLRGKTFYPIEPLSHKQEVQINIGPPWMRFTGKQTPYSAEHIGVVTLETLADIFAFKYHEEGANDPFSKGFHMEPLHPIRVPLRPRFLSSYRRYRRSLSTEDLAYKEHIRKCSEPPTHTTISG